MRPRMYNPYAMVRNTRVSFKPEARIYSKEEYSNLHPHQDFKLMKEEEKLSPRHSWCPSSRQLQLALCTTDKHMNKIELTFRHHNIC